MGNMEASQYFRCTNKCHMKFLAQIRIMPKKELLDPQGKTVAKNMINVGIQDVEDVRIGKFIEMTFDAASEDEARSKVEEACQKILANVIMEGYEFDLHQVETA